MATVAIDFGAERTRLAVYDRRTQCPTIRLDIPTLAHVPGSGHCQVGESAVEAIKSDPAGAVEDLKSRLGGPDLVRNRRRCRPADLLVELLVKLRETAHRQADIDDPLTDCCLTVPLQFNTRQSELLQEAVRFAGFSNVSTMDAPIAVIRHQERQRKIEADHAIVCDLGRKARVAVLARGDSCWRADQEIHPPRECEIPSIPPKLLMDALGQITRLFTEKEIVPPPLLLVGGNTLRDGIREAFRREGWKGEVIVSETPIFAESLGAVDVSRICPECGSTQVPFLRVCCPSCGCPSCPECHAIVHYDSPSCRGCGFPLKVLFPHDRQS